MSKYKNREIVSVDYRGITNTDAFGLMVALSKKVVESPDLILVIENISEIYSDSLYEDPQYIENLLGHSWKNDIVFFGDYRIDRREMTIILTSTPEYEDFLVSKFCSDGFAWIDSLDEDLETINNQLKKLV